MKVKRRGLTLLEVLVASVLLLSFSLPLLELFGGGIRTTRSTIQEVMGAHLAAEIAEQTEILPFDVALAAAREATGSRLPTFAVESGARVSALSDFRYELSPLPAGFARGVIFRELDPETVLVSVEVSWMASDARNRQIVLRRCLTRDSLIPP